MPRRYWTSAQERAKRQSYTDSKKAWKVNNLVKRTVLAIVLGMGISSTHWAGNLHVVVFLYFETLKSTAVGLAPELELHINRNLVIVDKNKNIVLLYFPSLIPQG